MPFNREPSDEDIWVSPKFRCSEYEHRFNNGSYSHSYASVRGDLLSKYHLINNFGELDSFEIKESGTDPSAVCGVLQQLNAPYSQRNCVTGIYYAQEYPDRRDSANMHLLNGMTNSAFWDVKKSDNCLFQTKDGVDIRPSEALKAFFYGPTVADCGSVLNACVYQIILNRKGVEEFDKIFGGGVSKFVITPYNFQLFESENKGFLGTVGNPLYRFYDCIYNVHTRSEALETHELLATLKTGDLVYIKGVEKYEHKHLVGAGVGWNLVCYRPTPESEPLFLGFGPNKFSPVVNGVFTGGFLTYEQVKMLLIDSYNQPQNAGTHHKLATFVPKTESDKTAIRCAGSLVTDVVDYFHPIVGIQNVIRMNLDRLDAYTSTTCEHSDMLWRNIRADTKLVLKHKKSSGILMRMSDFPVENRDCSFESYIVSDGEKHTVQTMLLETCSRFAQSVCSDKFIDITPIGLILCGSAGIGKTHLAISIAKNALKYGRTVSYLDSMTISRAYQESGGTTTDFSDCFYGADLIVFDDINAKYGSAHNVYVSAMNYCFKNKKAFVVSTNTCFFDISSAFPRYLNFDELETKNIVILKDLNAESYRHQNSVCANIVNIDLSLNAPFKIARPFRDSNWVFVNATFCFDSVAVANVKAFAEREKLSKHIYIAQDAYRGGIVHDLYLEVLDHEQFDAVIIVVDNEQTAEQFHHLTQIAHNKKIRIFVITSNLEHFRDLVIQQLNSRFAEEERIRVVDRLKAQFKGVFDNVDSDAKQKTSQSTTTELTILFTELAISRTMTKFGGKCVERVEKICDVISRHTFSNRIDSEYPPWSTTHAIPLIFTERVPMANIRDAFATHSPFDAHITHNVRDACQKTKKWLRIQSKHSQKNQPVHTKKITVSQKVRKYLLKR
ncbi:hypothetical protein YASMINEVIRUS_341 [Yasminevirus sp. GU-2018]|uniref:IstB-like ATP-binding domain-containing protein n=1 Tax=Yasminevirus sp. GU-2018 TaxID=2420051 RepID=A0A5K0U7G4_9VIRU|nr:hypothetical protein YASMINEVIRUS_341 [Yasminevirus sp. GU-2018]